MRPEKFPPRAQSVYNQLDTDHREMMTDEISKRERSGGIAFVLWLLLGWHYAYVGRWGIQFLFWLTAGGFLVWWLADLFRLGGIIHRKNQELALEVAQSYAALRSAN